MAQTKPTYLFLLGALCIYSGCSTSNSGNADLAPDPAPVVVAEPEPEPVKMVEPEVVEVVVEPAPVVVAEVVAVDEPVGKPVKAEPASLTILGFIKYVELEGGFFGIMTEDGAKYFPDYLGPEFKQDGLDVRVQALPQEQILGIQMWGTPIKILKIESNK
jgi:hypothetical protein